MKKIGPNFHICLLSAYGQSDSKISVFLRLLFALRVYYIKNRIYIKHTSTTRVYHTVYSKTVVYVIAWGPNTLQKCNSNPQLPGRAHTKNQGCSNCTCYWWHVHWPRRKAHICEKKTFCSITSTLTLFWKDPSPSSIPMALLPYPDAICKSCNDK